MTHESFSFQHSHNSRHCVSCWFRIAESETDIFYDSFFMSHNSCIICSSAFVRCIIHLYLVNSTHDARRTGHDARRTAYGTRLIFSLCRLSCALRRISILHSKYTTILVVMQLFSQKTTTILGCFQPPKSPSGRLNGKYCTQRPHRGVGTHLSDIFQKKAET